MGAPKKSIVPTTSSTTTPSSTKRKQPHASASNNDDSKTPTKKQRLSQPMEEKRLRRFRPKPPQSFHDLHARALTQRFFVLSRQRTTPSSLESSPASEIIELTGSTGNIYTILISLLPTCTCPHFARTNQQCKHIIYVLSRVLRCPAHLVYQLAFLTTELNQIFAGAPPIVSGGANNNNNNNNNKEDGKRKPVEGDCPICFEELDTATKKEEIVWCKAACGQNVHKQCFDMWAATKRGQRRGEVTCPYCRSVWEKESEGEMVKKVNREKGKRSADGGGYVNVAEQLGISPVRDTSSYSRWWSGHPSGYRDGYYY